MILKDMQYDKNEVLRFHIKEGSGVRRIQEPITVGIPFPRGQCYEPDWLQLYEETTNSVIPVQVEVTTRWPDQSIQWALVDFLADVERHASQGYRLECQEDSPVHTRPSPLKVLQSSDSYVVETGVATFALNPTMFTPFSQVVLEDSKVLEEGKTGFILTDEKDKEIQPKINRMVVERQGPVRVTLRYEGSFPNEHSSELRFIARLSFFCRSSTVILKFTLHNPQAAQHPGGCWDLGDTGSLFFKDLSWQLNLKMSRNTVCGWKTNIQEPLNLEENSSITIYQDSSGGLNWDSCNHVNKDSQVRQRFSGYQVERDGVAIEEGKRAIPSLTIHQGDLVIEGTIQHFWQNFPKALEADNRTLRLYLFPRQFDDMFELQGGEQKTHTCVVSFSKDHKQVDLSWIHDPLRPIVPPEWYAQTRAIRYLTPRSQDRNLECGKLIDTVLQEPNSWFSRREHIDEYGWRHFGEIYADHEAVQSAGISPFVSHFNNQYDVIYGLLVEYLRTGDQRWFVLMQDLARHVIDIDIYHTRDDRPAYNGGLFWHSDHYKSAETATHRTYSRVNREKLGLGMAYGGGPSNEHNYTTGLLHYYFLTGDSLAADVVQGLADWVINMDDPQSTMLGKLDSRSTGLASSTVEREYHGPGRGGGNSVNALLDAFVLTRERRYVLKAEELIRRCIHPRDDISRHHLEDIEHRWSYTVFLASLGKYLDLKVAEGELDRWYAYGREALLHYANWMVEHETPYKQILHRVEIPTETWSAHDMRKSHVLNVAAKYAQDPLRRICQKKARFFFDACLTDLNSFKTRTLVRPVVLVLTNGYVQAFCDMHSQETAPLPKEKYDFGRPQQFSPQGHELYRLRNGWRAFHSSLNRWTASWRKLLGSRKRVSH